MKGRVALEEGDPMQPPNPSLPPTQSAWPSDRTAGPTAGLVYAGFGVRLGALIIDLIVLGIVGSAISSLFGLGFLGFYGWDWRDISFWRFNLLGGAWLAWVVIQAVVSGSYFVYGWTHWGASFGQRLLNLQVLNDADGSMLRQDVAIRRWAFITVPVVGSLPGMGLLVALYQLYLAYTTNRDPNKQGWHDHQCGTVVVRPR